MDKDFIKFVNKALKEQHEKDNDLIDIIKVIVERIENLEEEVKKLK